VDEKVANLILERLNRLDATLSRLDGRVGRIEDDIAVLNRRFDEVCEANNAAVGWAGFALANHETLARRLDDFARRIGRLEQGVQ
jgi:predicted nuclease with TOPRIM domain